MLNTQKFNPPSQEFAPQADEALEIDFGQIFKALESHKGVFFATALSVLGLVTVYTYTQTPIYQAQGQILLQSANAASSLTGLDQVLGGDIPKNTILATQVEVFLSSAVLDPVIKDLDLRTADSMSLLPSEVFRNRVNVVPVKDTSLLEVSFKDPDPQKAKSIINALMGSFIRSNIDANRLQFQSASKYISGQLPDTQKKLSEASDKLRLFKEQYKIVDLQAEADAGVAQISDLNNQLTKAQADLAGARNQENALISALGLTPAAAINISQLAESKAIQSTISQLQEVESQLAVERSIYQPSNPKIVSLEDQQNSLKQELSRQTLPLLSGAEKSFFDASANSPTRLLNDKLIEDPANGNPPTTVGTLSDPSQFQLGETELSLIRQLVTASITRSGAEQQLKLYEEALQNQKNRLESIPRLAQQQLELERQVDVEQVSFQNLLTAQRNAQLAEAQNIGEARIVQEAWALNKPISPRKSLNLLIGGLMGLAAGTGVVLLLHTLDQKLHSSKDIQDIFNLPLLASIALYVKTGELARKGPDLIMVQQPFLPLAEGYRMLIANLRFQTSHKSLRTIAISSSMPQEGKSTSSANIALSFIELGLKVLIIDADLRRPTQHQIWETPNRQGLSNVLANLASFEDSVYHESDRLHLLTSGDIPPNPVSMLSSKSLEILLQKLSKEYDYIIVDCPPLLIGPDALLIGNKCDGFLLTARPETLERNQAKQAVKILKQSSFNLLGLLINGVNPKQESEPYQYYGYGAETRNGDLKQPHLINKATALIKGLINSK